MVHQRGADTHALPPDARGLRVQQLLSARVGTVHHGRRIRSDDRPDSHMGQRQCQLLRHREQQYALRAGQSVPRSGLQHRRLPRQYLQLLQPRQDAPQSGLRLSGAGQRPEAHRERHMAVLRSGDGAEHHRAVYRRLCAERYAVPHLLHDRQRSRRLRLGPRDGGQEPCQGTGGVSQCLHAGAGVCGSQSGAGERAGLSGGRTGAGGHRRGYRDLPCRRPLSLPAGGDGHRLLQRAARRDRHGARHLPLPQCADPVVRRHGGGGAGGRTVQCRGHRAHAEQPVRAGIRLPPALRQGYSGQRLRRSGCLRQYTSGDTADLRRKQLGNRCGYL